MNPKTKDRLILFPVIALILYVILFLGLDALRAVADLFGV